MVPGTADDAAAAVVVGTAPAGAAPAAAAPAAAVCSQYKSIC